MATKLNVLRRSKRVETEFVNYFWPDREPDETGSVRDWKELWDCSGLGASGELIIIESKSWKWRSGPRGVWTLLDSAIQQLRKTYQRRGYAWAQVVHGFVPEDGIREVVGYKPLHSAIEDALCYFDWHGQMVVVPAHQFKASFMEGATDED